MVGRGDAVTEKISEGDRLDAYDPDKRSDEAMNVQTPLKG
jgi:hypothetical protein